MFQFSSQLDLHWTLQIMRLLLNSCQIVVLVQVIFVVIVFQQFFFLRITQYIRDTHKTRTLIPMNTRTQTLPLGASSNTMPANPQD
jgi:hypothetical protein